MVVEKTITAWLVEDCHIMQFTQASMIRQFSQGLFLLKKELKARVCQGYKTQIFMTALKDLANIQQKSLLGTAIKKGGEVSAP